MKNKTITSALFGILSVQSLLATTANANIATQSPGSREQAANTQDAALAEGIIQKRLVGFDPKQAVETLSYLYKSGIESFEKDGSVRIPFEIIQDVMEAASVDGIEVRILGVDEQEAKVKFAAYDFNKFDRTRIGEAKALANAFKLKCDMDGKW